MVAALIAYIRPNILMGVLAATNIALLLLAIAYPGWIGLWTLVLTSFYMSLMYPAIFALGLKRLGPNTTLGASILVMAIIGGAVATPVVGCVAERMHSTAWGFSVPLLGHLVVTWFAFPGSRIRATHPTSACKKPCTRQHPTRKQKKRRSISHAATLSVHTF